MKVSSDGLVGHLARVIFRTCGIVSICALAILMMLFLTVLLYGPNRSSTGSIGNIILAFWLITTAIGIVAAMVVVVSAIVLISMNRNRTQVLSRFAVLSVGAAIAFVPTNATIALTVLSLERIHFITVKNDSNQVVDSVRLVGGVNHEFGSLNPGDCRHLKFRIKREGNLVVIVTINGESSEVELDEWVHPMKGRGRNRTIILNSNGTLSVNENGG